MHNCYRRIKKRRLLLNKTMMVWSDELESLRHTYGAVRDGLLSHSDSGIVVTFRGSHVFCIDIMSTKAKDGSLALPFTFERL